MKSNKISKDILGIQPYADAIVKAIDGFFQQKEEDREGSLNVLISAQWGIGKTFILTQISEKLQNKNFKTFIFNPWRYSQSPLAIKRKFLQNLHEEFGGNVDLDLLYEGVEGEKQRNFVKEIVFVTTVFLRILTYAFLISLGTYLLLLIYHTYIPTSFGNFFTVLFNFLKLESLIEPKDFLIEISMVVGVLGALIPAAKFIFESISIKTKRAEVDSVEQFEEIFSEIIGQKNHPIVLNIFKTIKKIADAIWRFFAWDVYFLVWLDECKLRPYNIYVYTLIKTEKLKNRFHKKTNQILRKYPSIKETVTGLLKYLANIWNKKIVNDFAEKIISATTRDKYPRVAILIDDLDRCGESEVKNILDGFLTFFEKKNCTYIVTADHTVIERHISNQLRLEQRGETSNQETYSSPKEYLHKIFNLNFLVPSPPKNNLDDFLTKTSSMFGLASNPEIENFAYKFFNRNPRAIRRYYTKVKFNKDVAENILNDTEATQERRKVAELVSSKPELKAKIIALEMVAPKFFPLIVEAPQIAADCEAKGEIDWEKIYFSGRNITTKVNDWNQKDKEEIDLAEQILNSQPFVANEDVGYEMLISFSASTHSSINDTFDWPQIQQDMEKGNPVFHKVSMGTSDRGREIIRKQALEQYKSLKTTGEENNRHLIFQGMIEVGQASVRKDEDKENVMSWSAEVLNELATDTEDYILKIQPKDYAKLLEIFSYDENREKEILKQLLSQNPFRKTNINQNVFQAANVEFKRDDDAKLSSLSKAIIESTSSIFNAISIANVSLNYESTLIHIFSDNYQAEEDFIPQINRINYLNGLLKILSQPKYELALKDTIESIKTLPDKAFLNGITSESWNNILSNLNHPNLKNILLDAEIISQQTSMMNMLKGIQLGIPTSGTVRAQKIIEAFKPILAILPSQRDLLSEAQEAILKIFIDSVSQTPKARDSKDILKVVSDILPNIISILNENEKVEVIEIYKQQIKISSDIDEIEKIKAIVEQLSLSEIVELAKDKIKLLTPKPKLNKKRSKLA